MARKVKKDAARRTGRAGRGHTRVSAKHQVTIPAGEMRSAGIRPGDRLRAEARGPGRLLLTRVDELVDGYSGALDSGGALREATEALREEWR